MSTTPLDGHPSRYQPSPTGLNLGEQTGTGVFPLVIAVPAEARFIRAPNSQCFDVYVELLYKDCVSQLLSLNKQSKVTTGTIT